MTEPFERPDRATSSRRRYQTFVEDYKLKRLDEKTEALANLRRLTPQEPGPDGAPAGKGVGSPGTELEFAL